jgi:hypothetical protein
MPKTPVQPIKKRITNEDLAAQILGVEGRLGSRLDKLETTVKTAGLNGHSDLLAKFLTDYAAKNTTGLAWIAVKADLSHRLRFLTSPKAWVRALFYAVLGGVGWKLVSSVPFPHL